MRDPPRQPGFYWAKWRKAAPGTIDNGYGCDGNNASWEVVEVIRHSIEVMMVMVSGVEQHQRPEDFTWGVGPLPEPSDEEE